MSQKWGKLMASRLRRLAACALRSAITADPRVRGSAFSLLWRSVGLFLGGLQSGSRSRSLPHALVARAKILLWSAGRNGARRPWGSGHAVFASGVCRGSMMNCATPVRSRLKTSKGAALLTRTLSRRPKAGNPLDHTVRRLFQTFLVP